MSPTMQPQRLYNPPYDQSEPCPACILFHGHAAFAYVHNFLNRCDVQAGRISEGKAWVKLNDLRRFGTDILKLKSDHPIIQEVIDVTTALIEACHDMTDDVTTIKWTPQTRERVEALIQRAAKALDDADPLIEAHRDDARHGHNGENVLRAAQGGHWGGHLTRNRNTSYNYTVVEVQGGPYDLRHKACGRTYVIHDHFKERIRRDPTFYGKVWCDSCRINAGWHQFECTVV